MAKSIPNVEPAYAQVRVAEIDARLAAIKDESAALTEKRKLYVPHLPKRSQAKD